MKLKASVRVPVCSFDFVAAGRELNRLLEGARKARHQRQRQELPRLPGLHLSFL